MGGTWLCVHLVNHCVLELDEDFAWNVSSPALPALAQVVAIVDDVSSVLITLHSQWTSSTVSGLSHEHCPATTESKYTFRQYSLVLVWIVRVRAYAAGGAPCSVSRCDDSSL